MRFCDLNGRKICVTGASSGLGRATAILLSKLGASVCLVARDHTRLEQTAGLLDGSGHRVEPFDLARSEDIADWLQNVGRCFGPFSGLVHAAGIYTAQPLRYAQAVDIEAVMRVNFQAAVHLAQGFRRKGISRPRASIVFVSSTRALTGESGVAVYSASKGALTALARSLAIELARDDIRVNCVAPGWVTTEMTDRTAAVLTPEQLDNIRASHPLGTGTPEDVAAPIAFLISDASHWITGTTLVVDGGYTAR